MNKEEFNKVASFGDLIIVKTKSKGRYIDRLNSRTAHLGVYIEGSETVFHLGGVIDLDSNPKRWSKFPPHSECYENIESIIVIQIANRLNEIVEKISSKK